MKLSVVEIISNNIGIIKNIIFHGGLFLFGLYDLLMYLKIKNIYNHKY